MLISLKTDQRRSHCADFRGKIETNGPMVAGQRRSHLRDDCLETSERHDQPGCLVSHQQWSAYYHSDRTPRIFLFHQRYTTKPGNDPVYAILLKYPTQTQQVKITAPIPSQTTSISLLGYNGTLDWTASTQAIYIDLTNVNLGDLKWAWVFKLTDVN